MTLERRSLLLAAPALPLLAAAKPAQAETTDLILNCDITLGWSMAQAARIFLKTQGVRVNVFPTAPGLILPQIARHIQNDMIITRSDAVAQAIAAETIAPDAPRAGQWRNRLVIAGRRGATTAATAGHMAVPDATPGSDFDGHAVIRAMKLTPAVVTGVIDTDTVAWLLLRGEADAGVLHATDVRANPGLQVIATVPETAAAPILYSIAVTKLSRRPHPDAFISFLRAPAGAASLRASGLEGVA